MPTIEVVSTVGACSGLPSEVLTDTVGARFPVLSQENDHYVIKGDDFIRGLKNGGHSVAADYHQPMASQSTVKINASRCRVIG